MELKFLNAPFELKEDSVNIEERTFEGYASVFAVLDLDGNVNRTLRDLDVDRTPGDLYGVCVDGK